MKNLIKKLFHRHVFSEVQSCTATLEKSNPVIGYLGKESVRVCLDRCDCGKETAYYIDAFRDTYPVAVWKVKDLFKEAKANYQMKFLDKPY